MTQQEFDEIKKRCDAAPKGPWFVTEVNGVCAAVGVSSKTPIKIRFSCVDGRLDGDFEEAAEFAAHAREDVPKLLGKIKWLRAEIKRAEWGGHCASYGAHCPYCTNSQHDGHRAGCLTQNLAFDGGPQANPPPSK